MGNVGGTVIFIGVLLHSGLGSSPTTASSATYSTRIEGALDVTVALTGFRGASAAWPVRDS